MSTSDDPTWVYFDTQHKYVMDQLKEVFKVTSENVERTQFALIFCFNLLILILWTIYHITEAKIKMESEHLDANALALIVVPQLRAGIVSIDSKQPESIIGRFETSIVGKSLSILQ